MVLNLCLVGPYNSSTFSKYFIFNVTRLTRQSEHYFYVLEVKLEVSFLLGF